MATPLLDLEPLRPVIARRPLGLISDIDGTLSPIVPRPEEAYVPEETRSLLQALLARGVFIALVSGRTLADARRLVGLEGPAYAGNHGLALWVDGRQETLPEAARYEARARRALGELGRLNQPGVWLEDKGIGISIHYRQAGDPAAARRAILEAVAASPGAQGFQVLEGRRVVELRPALSVHKGTALARLARRRGLRGLLCLGDDTTDIDMFRAARALRGALAACVAVESQEMTPAVLASADYTVKGVEGVRWLLSGLLKGLP